MLDFADVSPESWSTIQMILDAPGLLARCLEAFAAGNDAATGFDTVQAVAQAVREFSAARIVREQLDPNLVQWQFVATAIEPVLFALAFDEEIRDWTDAVEAAQAD